MSFWAEKNVLVAGGKGFFGSHVVELLEQGGCRVFAPSSKEFDFRNQLDCREAVREMDFVFDFAATVGGIKANMDRPGEFFLDNILIGTNLLEQSRIEGIEKFVGIGTTCSYPKFAPVPFKEEDFWNGYPDETNAPYGLAKKMLLVQQQAYRQQYGFNSIYLVPTNLYGPRDNFDADSSHVIPGMIRKILDALELGKKQVVFWGNGKATRDFLFVEDAAEAVVLAAEKYSRQEPVNLGTGKEISIRELAEKIVSIAGFDGKVLWDTSKPNGQPRRCLDTSRARKFFGWQAKTGIDSGLKKTIEWFKENPSGNTREKIP